MSYPEELTEDQVLYLRERADATRKRWKEFEGIDGVNKNKKTE